MLSDLVLAALRVATRAAVVATRAASRRPRAIGAFAAASTTPSRSRPAEPAGVSYVSPDDGVGVEESKGAEPFEETPSESTEGSSLGTEEEDKLYASLDAELELGSGSTAQRRRRGSARCSSRWWRSSCSRRPRRSAGSSTSTSAAPRGRALETAIVLRVCRAVHDAAERGLLSTTSAAGANALELGQQFLRTDAALDLAVGAALRHADTVRVAGARSGDTDLSPRDGEPARRAADAGARGLYVGGAARWSAPAPFVSLARDGCRRKACARLAALLRHREATERRGRRRAPDDHLVAFDAYSALNENLLTVARDAAVELMRAGLRAQHLAPSLVASVALAAYKEHAAAERASLPRTSRPTPGSGGAARAPPNRRSTPARGAGAHREGDGDEAQGHEDEQEEAARPDGGQRTAPGSRAPVVVARGVSTSSAGRRHGLGAERRAAAERLIAGTSIEQLRAQWSLTAARALVRNAPPESKLRTDPHAIDRVPEGGKLRAEDFLVLMATATNAPRET
ncbi:hypothetical protein JL721_4882 [Aureococcus anophagefferens]|nr:hypothetical protein JL721_4882 [Aureococcus anophagefferens]